MKAIPIVTKFVVALLFTVTLMLTSCSNDGYEIVDGKVYYKSWTWSFGTQMQEVEGADASTFKSLDDHFGHDAKHAWYEERLLKGANGASFDNIKKSYATDGKMVFYKDNCVPGADAKTFKVHTEMFTEDGRDYYWKGFPLYVYDKESFELLGDDDDDCLSWAKDKQYVYFLGNSNKSSEKRIRQKIADYDSFCVVEDEGVDDEVYSGHFAKDDVQVYYCDTIVPGADPKTIKEVAWCIAQDKNRVYFGDIPTEIRDFHSLTKGRGKYVGDGNVYNASLQRMPDGTDSETFQRFNEFADWYKDKNRVYWENNIVEGADVETFMLWTDAMIEEETQPDTHELTVEELDYYRKFARDKNHVYHCGKIVPDADPKDLNSVALK